MRLGLTNDEFLALLHHERDNNETPDRALSNAQDSDAIMEAFNEMELADLLQEPLPTKSGWLPSLPWLKK